MESLYRVDILKLEDKDLQLRYLLGGLSSVEKVTCDANRFWSCDVRCSVTAVSHDERLIKVQKFIEKHNISNFTFIKLVQSYLRGTIMTYNGSYGSLFIELEEAISDYGFVHFENSVIDNNLGEKELLSLIEKSSNEGDSKLALFLKKYSLTLIDFMVLSKTSLNYSFCIVHGVKNIDLSADLISLLAEYGLNYSYEEVLSYQSELEKSTEGNRKSLLKSIFRRK